MTVMRLKISMTMAIATAITMLVPDDAAAEEQCRGHELLAKPRPEASCLLTAPPIYPSPDKALRAVVVPSGITLHATPDIESRVVIRTAAGDTLTSRDFSSPNGTNGYYVHQAAWSPNSQFFVFTMISSGGHSPWQFPTVVYGRKENAFARLSDMIGGRPIIAGEFSFGGPQLLVATTWKQPGDIENGVAVRVDLGAAFEKLPSSLQ